MLALSQLALSYGPSLAPAPAQARAQVRMETTADLKDLAKKLNPVVGYWNPLKIGDPDAFAEENGIFPFSDEQVIGFFRHAEIKHGRIAMAAFVGFLVGESRAHFPWMLSGDVSFGDIAAAGGPGAQWDALSIAAKFQIFSFIFLMEAISESQYALEASGMKHYMRGGKPGSFPSIKGIIPHPVPFDFFDPAGFTKNLSAEQKETKLLAEINNGRLAMIGMLGLCAASKGLIVPGLDELPLTPYAGEYMKPFEGLW